VHVLENPSHSAAAGGKLFLRRQNARMIVAGPANDFRGGSGSPYSSRRSRDGKETVVDIHLHICPGRN
jgi:hypothetical protein